MPPGARIYPVPLGLSRLNVCKWCAASAVASARTLHRSQLASAGPIPIIAALGIQPTYSARQAAVLLGRSYSWLDQRLRKGQFVLPDGTMVQPLRTAGGYRRFTLAMLEDIALSSYRNHWFSMGHLKSTYRELLIAAHRDTGEAKIPS